MAVVTRFQPDLVILDINLGDMRGDTAIKMVRRASIASRYSHLPVMILSGLPLDQLMAIQGSIGAVACLQKPASLQSIVDHVCQILSVPKPDGPAQSSS